MTRYTFWIGFVFFTAGSAYHVTFLPLLMKSYFCSTASPMVSLWTQGEGTAWAEVRGPALSSSLALLCAPGPAAPSLYTPCLPAPTHSPHPGRAHGAGGRPLHRPQTSAGPLWFWKTLCRFKSQTNPEPSVGGRGQSSILGLRVPAGRVSGSPQPCVSPG